MKHPASHVSRSVRKVNRARGQVSRQLAAVVEKTKYDPSFQNLLKELAKRAAEIAIRILLVSAWNQCIRSGGEQPRVIPLRPRPIS